MANGLVDWDKVTSAYVKIRDERSNRKRAWEADDRILKEKLEALENFTLGYLNENHQEKFSTLTGTVFKSLEIIPTASDWGAFYKWIAENDTFDALERRIKSTFISAYMEQNKGAIPPGVSVFRRYRVNVRRSKNREMITDVDDSDE